MSASSDMVRLRHWAERPGTGEQLRLNALAVASLLAYHGWPKALTAERTVRTWIEARDPVRMAFFLGAVRRWLA